MKRISLVLSVVVVAVAITWVSLARRSSISVVDEKPHSGVALRKPVEVPRRDSIDRRSDATTEENLPADPAVPAAIAEGVPDGKRTIPVPSVLESQKFLIQLREGVTVEDRKKALDALIVAAVSDSRPEVLQAIHEAAFSDNSVYIRSHCLVGLFGIGLLRRDSEIVTSGVSLIERCRGEERMFLLRSIPAMIDRDSVFFKSYPTAADRVAIVSRIRSDVGALAKDKLSPLEWSLACLIANGKDYLLSKKPPSAPRD